MEIGEPYIVEIRRTKVYRYEVQDGDWSLAAEQAYDLHTEQNADDCPPDSYESSTTVFDYEGDEPRQLVRYYW